MEGQVIADRYRLIRMIGKGGMGSVWLAQHLTLQSEVAVKLIDSQLANHPEARSRFLREAQLAARIKSPHVVQMYDHGVSTDGRPYIAMEYLVGMSLRDRLHARTRMTLSETARLLSHLCRALAHAHEASLVHRDLKPENIFLARVGSDEIVKVLDFGVAKATDALADSGIDPTRTGALLGTPFYMSPEQAQGLKTVDYRTDLWAVGVVVFECITGKRPFGAEALGPLIGKILGGPIPVPSSTAPDARISRDVDAWMVRALARDPGARFASAKDLAESFMIASGMTDSLPRDRSSGGDVTGGLKSSTSSSVPGEAGLADTIAAPPPQVMNTPPPAGMTMPIHTLPLAAGTPRPISYSAPPPSSTLPAPFPPVMTPMPPPPGRRVAVWIAAFVVIVVGVGVAAIAVMLLRR
jgi:serine/threonine-protein kinase